jgi:hypothetical protein
MCPLRCNGRAQRPAKMKRRGRKEVASASRRTLASTAAGPERRTRKQTMGSRKPPLKVEQILTWADAHRERMGAWPTAASGPVLDAPGEVWGRIQECLRRGLRGLPGGDTLPRLLARRRGRRVRQRKTLLSEEQLLSWADAHHRRTGRWPTAASGPITEASGENWRAVNLALGTGDRGLRGGDSLARLLHRHGRRRSTRGRPSLSSRAG